MQFNYLTETDIIEINEYQIKTYSPKEPIGLVNRNSLKALVELPKQYFYDFEPYPNIQLKSAILFRSLVKKHVFINANKRTAFMALDIFLEKNGYKLCVGNGEGEEFTVAVDTEDIELETIAEWINERIRVRE